MSDSDSFLDDNDETALDIFKGARIWGLLFIKKVTKRSKIHKVWIEFICLKNWIKGDIFEYMLYNKKFS